ncbi:MAG: ATP-binding protein [Planctomycetaceae bacterium]|nr:ATP-binding protein [Planctomycetaceae bacterium]
MDVVETVLAHSLRRQNEHRLFECISSQQLELKLTDNDRKFVPSVVQYLQQLSLAIGLTNSADNVQLGVALEETLINAVVHGNLEVSSELKQQDDNAYGRTIEQRRRMEPYCDRVIRISVSLTPDEGRFTILDQGPGFDVSSLPDPTDPENLLKPSGRGIMLINAFMDGVQYNDAGNQITLVKKRQRAEEASDARVDVDSTASVSCV